LPNLLRKVKENIRHTDTFRLFEWESVFEKYKASEVRETKMLALVSVSRDGGPREFTRLKGALENFLETLSVSQVTFVPHALPTVPDEWHRTQSADILVKGKRIGTIGTLTPFVLQNFGIGSGVAAAVVDIEALRDSVVTEVIFEPLPKFPFAVRDLSLIFPARQASGAVRDVIERTGAPLLRSAELFDVFEREGRYHLAFHLVFGANERTLTSEEMDGAFGRIVAQVATEMGGRLHQ
ncbi:MAG: hypothetical protein KBA91_04310, partial [Candidatus Moranbacteria bacterium]|nr:hypothetical protein [Candidatus Moranbacteria bacterium]